jgi:PKHD-type hydroxylase
MQCKNLYYWFKSALTPDQCQRLIDSGLSQMKKEEESGRSVEATTFGRNDKHAMLEKNQNVTPQADKTIDELRSELGDKTADVEKDRYVRDSQVSWLDDRWIYDLIHPFLRTANKEAGWNFEWDYSEAFQFTKYNKGGFYGWHADGNSCNFGKYKRIIPGVSPKNADGTYPSGYTINPNMVGKVRKLSMTINLNKPGEYEGGNLKFDFGPHAQGRRFHECTEIRPQGSIIVFPSFVYHQVTPVTRGTRYSMVLWSLGQPFK